MQPTDSQLRAAYSGKRVLVTGHTGFKGSWLVLWLNELGAEVTGYALPPDTQPSLFEDVDVAGSCDHLLGDVRDLERAFPGLEGDRSLEPLVRERDIELRVEPARETAGEGLDGQACDVHLDQKVLVELHDGRRTGTVVAVDAAIADRFCFNLSIIFCTGRHRDGLDVIGTISSTYIISEDIVPPSSAIIIAILLLLFAVVIAVQQAWDDAAVRLRLRRLGLVRLVLQLLQ